MGNQNVLTEASGPTSYAKRQIVEGDMFSAFQLFIDDFIICEIKMCTETEARSKLNNDSWSVSEEEIYHLLAIMLARGVIAKSQPIFFL